MKARILLIGAALVGTTAMMAQDNQLSLGADIALPLGDFGKAYSLGIGPTVGFEIPVGDNLGVTLQAGYDIMMVKSDQKDFIKSASMIPAQVGLKYYFQDQQEGFYAHGQLGIHNTSLKTKEQDLGLITIPSETSTSTNFSWALGVGYQLESLDLGLRYNSISPDSDAKGAKAASYIGLRIAYLIHL
ncbi:MAG: OmpW family outer membrane protein [Flavobacteriales bacterium]